MFLIEFDLSCFNSDEQQRWPVYFKKRLPYQKQP